MLWSNQQNNKQDYVNTRIARCNFVHSFNSILVLHVFNHIVSCTYTVVNTCLRHLTRKFINVFIIDILYKNRIDIKINLNKFSWIYRACIVLKNANFNFLKAITWVFQLTNRCDLSFMNTDISSINSFIYLKLYNSNCKESYCVCDWYDKIRMKVTLWITARYKRVFTVCCLSS